MNSSLAKLLFLLLIFGMITSSCGEDVCKYSDFTTKHDVCVFLNGYHNTNREKIELVTDAIIEHIVNRNLDKYPVKAFDSLEQVPLKLIWYAPIENGKTAGGYTSYQKIGLGDGFYIHNYEMVVRVKDKVCNELYFTYIHEYIHFIRLSIQHEAGHGAYWFEMPYYTEDSNSRSIQREIYNNIKCSVCSCN